MSYFHVRLSVLGQRHDEIKADIDEETLERQFLLPYRSGSPVTINGRSLDIDEISRIRISKSDVPIGEIENLLRQEDRLSSSAVFGGPPIAWRAAAKASDVTDEFITGPPGSNSDSLQGEDSVQVTGIEDPTEFTSEANSVFIVTGRDSTATSAVVAVLRSMNLRIIEWEHAVAMTGLPSPYVGDVVSAGLTAARAAVVVITPDDLVMLRPDLLNDGDKAEERSLTGQARPNVFYEAGYADAIGRNRTVIVEIGNPKSFTDIAGRHVVKYDGSPAKRNALAERLKLAGVYVDTSGQDWLTVGDLEPILSGLRSSLDEATSESADRVAGGAGTREGIESLLALYADMKSRSQYSDLSDFSDESWDIVLQTQALVARLDPESSYTKELERTSSQPVHIRLPVAVSTLRSVLAEMDR